LYELYEVTFVFILETGKNIGVTHTQGSGTRNVNVLKLVNVAWACVILSCAIFFSGT